MVLGDIICVAVLGLPQIMRLCVRPEPCQDSLGPHCGSSSQDQTHLRRCGDICIDRLALRSKRGSPTLAANRGTKMHPALEKQALAAEEGEGLIPNPWPLFVVGVARSGTSLLYALLNQHPQIAILFEGSLPFLRTLFRVPWARSDWLV